MARKESVIAIRHEESGAVKARRSALENAEATRQLVNEVKKLSMAYEGLSSSAGRSSGASDKQAASLRRQKGYYAEAEAAARDHAAKMASIEAQRARGQIGPLEANNQRFDAWFQNQKATEEISNRRIQRVVDLAQKETAKVREAKRVFLDTKKALDEALAAKAINDQQYNKLLQEARMQRVSDAGKSGWLKSIQAESERVLSERAALQRKIDDADRKRGAAQARQATGQRLYVPHPIAQADPKRFATILADAQKLEAEWAKDVFGYLPKKGIGASEIAGRREQFRKFLRDNPTTPIQQPQGGINAQGGLSFNDGRHRTRVLLDAGAKVIPITVPASDAAKVQKMVGASDARQSEFLATGGQQQQIAYWREQLRMQEASIKLKRESGVIDRDQANALRRIAAEEFRENSGINAMKAARERDVQLRVKQAWDTARDPYAANPKQDFSGLKKSLSDEGVSTDYRDAWTKRLANEERRRVLGIDMTDPKTTEAQRQQRIDYARKQMQVRMDELRANSSGMSKDQYQAAKKSISMEFAKESGQLDERLKKQRESLLLEKEAERIKRSTLSVEQRRSAAIEKVNKHLEEGRISSDVHKKAVEGINAKYSEQGGLLKSIGGQIVSAGVGLFGVHAILGQIVDAVEQWRESNRKMAEESGKAASALDKQQRLLGAQTLKSTKWNEAAVGRIRAVADRYGQDFDSTNRMATAMVGAGFSETSSTAGGLDTMMKLYTATDAKGLGVSPEGMANFMGKFMEANNLSKSDPKVLTKFARAFASEIAKGTQLKPGDLEFAAQEAGSLSQRRVTPEEQFAMLAQGSSIQEARKSTTAFRNIMGDLINASASKTATDALAEIGLSPADVDNINDGGTFKMLRRLKEKIEALPAERRGPLTAQLFGGNAGQADADFAFSQLDAIESLLNGRDGKSGMFDDQVTLDKVAADLGKGMEAEKQQAANLREAIQAGSDLGHESYKTAIEKKMRLEGKTQAEINWRLGWYDQYKSWNMSPQQATLESQGGLLGTYEKSDVADVESFIDPERVRQFRLRSIRHEQENDFWGGTKYFDFEEKSRNKRRKDERFSDEEKEKMQHPRGEFPRGKSLFDTDPPLDNKTSLFLQPRSTDLSPSSGMESNQIGRMVALLETLVGTVESQNGMVADQTRVIAESSRRAGTSVFSPDTRTVPRPAIQSAIS